MEPTVKIINFTNSALELLIYSKSGRLKAGTSMNDILGWPEEQKMEHLAYMMDTIQSAFEFVDYVFEIKNVSRAFTHQLVRTRTASFQQEAMRVVDARDAGYLVSCTHPLYQKAADASIKAYAELVDLGFPVQDCRGLLPTAIHTGIQIKANLRTLSQMSELRLCKRAEGEYQRVFAEMVRLVGILHPWAKPMLQAYCVKTGLCYFPRYTKCPVQKFTINAIADRAKPAIQEAWEDTVHVANPVAVDGQTM